VKLTLSFSIIRCACGGERQAEQRCPVCGCEPEEVDDDLEGRRTLVRALDFDPPAPSEVEAVSLRGLWGELSLWLSRFMGVYEQATDGTAEEGAARIQLEINELAILRARVATAHRLRPYLPAWAAVDRVLMMEGLLVEQYAGALIAPTPEDAGSLADEAQTTLDELTEHIDRFNAVVDARIAVDEVGLDDEYADVAAGARAAFNLAGAENLIDFEENGATLYQRITGELDCPVGFGIRLQMANIFVESTLDQGRFWSAARTTYESVIGCRGAFALLAQDEVWRRDFLAVGREARDAGIEAAAIGEAALNRRRDLRSGIRLGAVITERLAPCLLATLLAISRRTSYAREKAKDVGTLLKEFATTDSNGLSVGIDLALRDADAHSAFDVADGGVHFTGTRREYDFLSDDQLVDRVLMGFESIFALNIGIAAALPAVGVEHEELEALMSDKPSSADLVRAVMAMNGWGEIEVARDGNTLRICGTRDVETPTGVAASVLPALDPDVSYLVFEGDGIGRRRVARGPVAPYRRGAETDDPAEKQAASLEAMATWTIEGKSPIAGSSLRKVIAITTLEALVPSKPQDDAVAALTAMAGLVERLAEQGLLRDRRGRTLETRVADALRLRKQNATMPVSHIELQPICEALERLAPERVPPLRTTW
jgi:hypothetical protein